MNVARTVSEIPSRSAVQPIVKVLFPGFAKISDDPDRLRRTYLDSASFLFWVTAPMGIGMAATADRIVALLLGEQWAGAAVIVQVLALNWVAQSLFGPLQAVAMAMGETRSLFVRAAFLGLIEASASLAAMLLGGFDAFLATSLLLTFVLFTPYNLIFVKRLLGIGIIKQVARNNRTFVSAVVMGMLIKAYSSIMPGASGGPAAALSLIGLVGVGVVSYLGICCLTWIATGRPDGVEARLAPMINDPIRRGVSVFRRRVIARFDKSRQL